MTTREQELPDPAATMAGTINVDEGNNAMSTPTYPSIRSIIEAALPPCPSWCVSPAGHFDPRDAFEGESFGRVHESARRFIELDRRGHSLNLAAAAEETVGLVDGRVTTKGPLLHIYGDMDELTVADCRRLIAALSEALGELNPEVQPA